MIGRWIMGAVVIILTSIPAARAQEIRYWGKVPGTDWELQGDATSCGVNKRFQDGTDLLLIAARDKWLIVLQNERWKLINDNTYAFVVQTDSTVWSASMKSVDANSLGQPVKPELISDLSRTSRIAIRRNDGAVIGVYSMKGSSRAITAAGRCNEVLMQEEHIPTPDSIRESNPFSHDPFGPVTKRRV